MNYNSFKNLNGIHAVNKSYLKHIESTFFPLFLTASSNRIPVLFNRTLSKYIIDTSPESLGEGAWQAL